MFHKINALYLKPGGGHLVYVGYWGRATLIGILFHDFGMNMGMDLIYPVELKRAFSDVGESVAVSHISSVLLLFEEVFISAIM